MFGVVKEVVVEVLLLVDVVVVENVLVVFVEV